MGLAEGIRGTGMREWERVGGTKRERVESQVVCEGLKRSSFLVLFDLNFIASAGVTVGGEWM